MIEDFNLKYAQLLANAIPATSVLLYKRKKGTFYFLVSRRLVPPDAGSYEIPGGKIEVDEKCRDAARRELDEEAGIFDNGYCLYPHLCSTQTFLESRRSYILFSFITNWRSEMGVPCNKESDKHTNWRWLSLKQLLDKYDKNKLSLGLQASVERLIENSERSELPRRLFGEYTVFR